MLPWLHTFFLLLTSAHQNPAAPFRMRPLEDNESTPGGDCCSAERESVEMKSCPECPATFRRLTDLPETLFISAETTVAAGSVLTLYKVTITPDSGFLATAFTVEGKLILTECAVENFGSAVFSVTGEVIATNSTFRNNRETVFFMLNEAKVRLLQIEVDSHMGTFLAYRGSGRPAISIEDSMFSHGIQSGTEAVMQITTYGASGNMSISGCTFASNRLRLLLLDVRSTAVSVRDSLFLSNSEALLTLYQSSGSTEVQSCRFLNNTNTVLGVYSLQGRLSVSEVQVSNHSSPFFFRVEKGGSESAAEFNDISITQSVTRFDVSPSAVFSVSACTVFIQNLTLRRVMLYARMGSNQVALFLVQQGALHLSNSTSTNSGTSGFILVGYFTTAAFTQCTFYNSTVLMSIYFGMMLGDMVFEGIEIGDLRGVHYANDFGLGAVYFGMSQSTLVVRNLFMVHADWFWATAIVAPRFSTFSLRNVELTNVTTSVGISLVASSGDITSFRATGCYFSYYVYQTVSNSQLAITEAKVTNSVFLQRESGIFSLCTKSRVTVSSLSVVGTKVSYFAKAKNSHLEIHGLFVSKCTLQHLLRDAINSQLLISGLQLVNSVGGLADAYNCNVTFADSLIESVSTAKFLIRTSATAVELRNVAIANVTVGKAVAYLQEASSLSLSSLRVRALLSLEGQGFIINSGNFTIDNSVFTFFVGSLFQAYDAVVSMKSSSFEHGYNLIESRISELAYGGVLGCIDCASIYVDNVTVRNVSTLYGGAMSLRCSSSEAGGKLVIKRSVFESCGAGTGGALYIRNLNFDIEGCYFRHNLAGESGGAIDVSVPENFTKSLRNLVFVNNSAGEGGAVKWRKAQVLLQNITATLNSAQYGPDIASYGIELSSRLADFSNFIASGYPLHLIYELLDHYGQRVTSSREVVLQLQSSGSIAFPGYSTVVRRGGLFNFTVPVVLAPPGSTQFLVAHVDVNEVGAVVDKRSVTFRKCVPGEADQTDKCVYCFSGHVSFRPETGECSHCPKHAFCSGGANMTIDSNYWRSSNSSLVLVECPMPGTCLGNNSCAYGFTGRFCNECIDGFYRFQMTGCEQCDEGAALYVQLVPILVVIALLVFFIIKYSTSETRLFILKTGLGHSQLLSAMSPMKGILPWSFRGFLHGLSYVSSFLIIDLPLSCMGAGNESVARAVAASCLLPFFSILTALIFVVRRNKEAVVCYTSSLLFLPTITIQSLLPLLACVNGDDERRWLFTDVSKECWNLDHQRLFYGLFLPSISISVLSPLLLAIGMAFNRPNDFLKYFPMWTCGYRWAPWDIIQSALKLSLQILMYSGLGFSRVGQFSSGLIVLYILCFANVFFVVKVYRGKETFWIAECSYLIVTMCYSMGGVYVFTEKGYSGSSVAFSIAFLMLNCGFYLCLAYFLLCDFTASKFPVPIVTEKLASDTRSHLHDESFGEAIVPNNSQRIDSPL